MRRFIVTGQVAKHRVFQFLDASILPDDKLIAIALDDAAALGILSSEVHRIWALASGGRLGIGNDPVYSKSTCFEAFPFPGRGWDALGRVRELGEQLDAHRKARQAEHADLTVTGLYNVLEKLRDGAALSTKERDIHDRGLVSVLRSLHDDLDRAVLSAYGWDDLLPLLRAVNGLAEAGTEGTPPNRAECRQLLDDWVLQRVVALNAERAAEEARGEIRWLRPEFQKRSRDSTSRQQQLDTTDDEGSNAAMTEKRRWPTGLLEQVKAVSEVLATFGQPQDLAGIAAAFAGRGRWRDRLPTILATLETLGKARLMPDGKWVPVGAGRAVSSRQAA